MAILIQPRDLRAMVRGWTPGMTPRYNSLPRQKKFRHDNTIRNTIICQNVGDIMLMTDFRHHFITLCWCLIFDVGEVTCHQHQELVTNTFGHPHRCNR